MISNNIMHTENEIPATTTMSLSNESSLIFPAAEKASGPKRGSSPFMMRLICIEAKQHPEINPKIAGVFISIYSPYNVTRVTGLTGVPAS